MKQNLTLMEVRIGPLCPESVVSSQICIYSALIIKMFLLYYKILSYIQFKCTNVFSPGLPIV